MSEFKQVAVHTGNGTFLVPHKEPYEPQDIWAVDVDGDIHRFADSYWSPLKEDFVIPGLGEEITTLSDLDMVPVCTSPKQTEPTEEAVDLFLTCFPMETQ